MRKSALARSCAVIALTIGALQAGAALAQTTPASDPTPAAQQDRTDRIDDIVVTAQRRDQGLSEVPISITALDGEGLERQGITKIDSLFAVTPALSYQGSQSSAGSGLRVRGVGSAAFNAGTEQSVSTIIDGVVTGPAASGLSDLFDVQRVEVLRGPQGTLFGKNASAGAINVVTNAPEDVFGGYGIVRYGEAMEEIRVEGAVTGPVGENTSVRLAGFYLDQNKGWTTNAIRGGTEDVRNRWGARFHLNNESGPLTTDFIYTYEQRDDDCCTRTFSGLEAVRGGLTNTFLIPRLTANGLTPSPDNRVSISEQGVEEKMRSDYAVLTLAYQLSGGQTIKSITGARKWKQYEFNDGDRIDIDVGSFAIQRRDLDLFTQELQLLSDADSRLQYVIGLYFYDQDLHEFTSTKGGSNTPFGLGETVVPLDVAVRNMAVYADATYDLTDQWQVFGGARLLKEEVEASGTRSGNFFAFPGTFRASVSDDDTNWVGRFGARYSLNQDMSFYGSVSRGYKGKAVDVSISSPFFLSTNPQSAVLRPETVLNFELGARTRFNDGRFVLNGTLFHSDFTDFQASQFDGTTAAFILRNAGKVRTQGLEVDFKSIPWDGGTLMGGFSFVDAVFDEYKGAPCTVPSTLARTCLPTVGQDLSGKQVNASPRYQFNVSYRHDFDFGMDDTFYVQGEYSWRDDVTFGGDLNPATMQPAYGVANFRAGIRLDDRYELVAFAENAFDETYAYRIIDAVLWSGAYQTYLAPGRTVGIELRADF